MILQVLRDQNVYIHGGADITVQPARARSDDEIIGVMLIQQRAHTRNNGA